MEAKSYLETNVLMHLDELSKRNKANEQIIRAAYKYQVDLVDDNSPEGVAKKIEQMEERQKSLKARLDQIREKLEKHKLLAANALCLSLQMRSKISAAERMYIHQLKEWTKVSGDLDHSIENLKRSQCRSLPQHHGLSSKLARRPYPYPTASGLDEFNQIILRDKEIDQMLIIITSEVGI